MKPKVVELKNGLRQVTSYYGNGKIFEIYMIDKDDLLQGICKSYHRDGWLNTKRTYKDNKLDGPCEEYYKNEQLKDKCIYKDGKLDGMYEAYYRDGQLLSKGIFKNGMCCSRIDYDKDGQPIRKNLYKNGILIENKLSSERKCINNTLQSINKNYEPTLVRKQLKIDIVKGYRRFYPDYYRAG